MLLAAFAAGAQSVAYPVKPVRVVIPWPPGGANDIVGRIVAQKMAEQLGQQFIIDNRGGGNDIAGRIVMQKVAESVGQQFTIDNRGGAGGQTRAVTRGPLAGWERP